jgi:hypothetical protein
MDLRGGASAEDGDPHPISIFETKRQGEGTGQAFRVKHHRDAF